MNSGRSVLDTIGKFAKLDVNIQLPVHLKQKPNLQSHCF